MLTATLAAGVAVAFVAVDVAMFGHDPLDPATQIPPSRPAVAGVWALDRAGRVEVGPAVTPGSRPRLVLHDDNTFSARDLPDWWNPDALVIPDKTGYRRAWRLVSGSGRWAVEKRPGGWFVALRFSTPPRLSAELRLYGQNPPHRLGVILGDPDEGRSLTFERTGPAPPPRRPFARDVSRPFDARGVRAFVTLTSVGGVTMIRYLQGDATQPQAKGNRIVAHVCNDLGGWGKGFVLAVSKRWPGPEAAYRAWHKGRASNDFGLGAVQTVQVEPYLWVANMVAQRGMKTGSKGPPIRYDALRTCLKTVAAQAKEKGASVHMPRIGCGLAGGRWEEVEPIVLDELTSQGVDVTVYDF